VLAVLSWTVAPLLALHVWWWLRRRELLRFQLVLDMVLAVVVGPALVRGADRNTVRCLSRNRPFTEWQWAQATQYQPTHSDLVLQIHPWLEETRRELLDGELPLISDRIGGGLPLLANGQTGLWAPVNLPVWALGVEQGTTVMAFWKLELAALGAFLLLLRGWRLSHHASAVGSIAWGGGCYLVAWLLVPMGWVIAAVPWLWWSVVWALRGGARPWRVTLAAVALGWLMGSGLNPETASIAAGSALLAGLVLHPSRWRRIAAIGLVAAALATLLAWPTFGYIQASEKLAQVRVLRPNESSPPLEIRWAAVQQLVVPMVHGHPGRGEWRGPYPYAAAAAGIGGLGLGLLVIGRTRRRHRGFACAAWTSLGVAVLLAYRLPPIDSVLVRLPPFDRMTLPRFILLAGWGLALWAALAVEGAQQGRRRKAPWMAIPAAAVGVVALLGGPWRLAQTEMALVALTVVAASASVSLLARPAWIAPVMALELALYAVGINPVAAVEDRRPRPPLLERLMAVQRAEGGRVLGLAGYLPANLAVRYGLSDLRAYDPLRPRPYVRMLAELGDPDPILGGPLSTAPAALAGAWSVRFLLTPPGQVPAGWRLRWRGPEGALWSNPLWLPEVRVVGRAVAVDDSRGWRLLTEGEVDLASAAVVPEGTPQVFAGRVAMSDVERRGPSITAKVRCSGPCLVVVARPWAPGWRAKVDGARVPLVRANLAGLGVRTPGGDRHIELAYHPWRW
jgi:hypothetical protein